MIQKYLYGVPFDTESVVAPIPASQGDPPVGTVKTSESGFCFACPLAEGDRVYGLGEANRGINKRGFVYVSDNVDDGLHTENKQRMYAAHNFIVISGQQNLGLFFDYPARIRFDIGFTRRDWLEVTCERADLALYVITGDSACDVVKQFRAIIGRSYIPPKFAFGFGQSRYGYKTQADFEEVVAKHRQAHIPLDMVYMDIDYMDHYKDFTVNPENFPDFSGFVSKMKEQGVRLVPIIDAGVKEEAGYSVCDEGKEKGYFCKRADGTDFEGTVWPGWSHFPDVLNPEARAWFGSQYKALTDCGIEGFWNDMNEPAIFYSREGLAERLDHPPVPHEDGTIDHFGQAIGWLNLSNAPEDYARFYHKVDGKMVRHDQVHNLYGGSMTRAAGEAFADLRPGQRTLLYSRSSFIGSHRYGGIWLGDNNSSWAQLLANIQMMPSVQMCGFLYAGADLCGFSSDTTPDLALRWLEFGLFTPLMRNHTAQHTRDQEIFRFRNWEDMRNVVSVRYALLPYLYSLLVKCACRDEMMFRPLAFDYPQDKTAIRVEDQLMLGDECMIAPVVEQNARGRHVYLPEDMLLVRFRSGDDYTVQTMQKGHHWLDVPMNEVPLFIRRGHVIPLCRSAEYVDALDTTKLSLVGWLEVGCAITLYEDDGESTDIDLNEGLQLINVSIDKGVATAKCAGKTIDASKVVVWER